MEKRDDSIIPLVDLSKYEKKIHSQNGEDGVLEKIFNIINTTDKYFVEIGCGNGSECNTRYLRESYGFNGLLLDSNYGPNLKLNLQKEFVTKENINSIFQKYNVPYEFDLLSLDIDGIDFYVWNVLVEYKPRVVVIEYNATHLADEDKVIIYEENFRWDHTNYFGASILAYYNLGRSKGYSLIYAENTGINIFFIRDDILLNLNQKFVNMNDVKVLYKKPRGKGPNGGHPEDKQGRKYLSSGNILT
jgi:hypothetical protein